MTLYWLRGFTSADGVTKTTRHCWYDICSVGILYKYVWLCKRWTLFYELTLHYSNYILSDCQNSKNKDNRNRQSWQQCTLRHQKAWKLKLFFLILHVSKKMLNFKNKDLIHKKVWIQKKNVCCSKIKNLFICKLSTRYHLSAYFLCLPWHNYHLWMMMLWFCWVGQSVTSISFSILKWKYSLGKFYVS